MDQQRDAIHVAVVPIEAGEAIRPGSKIKLHGKLASEAKTNQELSQSVGVADPFLGVQIQRGQWFWLFLNPGSITSLRHDWSHPAFEDDVPDAKKRAEAEAFLRGFAEEWGIDYKEMVRDAVHGYGITAKGRSIHSWGEVDSGDRRRFWESLEIITGSRFDDRHREDTYFSCSC